MKFVRKIFGFSTLASLLAVGVTGNHVDEAASVQIHASLPSIPIRHLDARRALPPERHVPRQATKASGATTSAVPSATTSSTNSFLPKASSGPPSSIPVPHPTPMDLQLSYALSQPCLLYLTSLLSSSNFTTCLPFSLLLTTSTSFGSFISATPPYDALNILLSYVTSPQPSSAQCDAFMSNAATAMGEKGKCGADINNKIPSALMAVNGLGNAAVMRQAAGLVDPDTGTYCYIQAINATGPDDLYLWSIPAGIGIPASSTPTCSKCSRQLLALLAENSDDYQTLNSTLINRSIATVNGQCGASFIDMVSYSATPKSDASRMLPSSSLCVSFIGMVVSVLASSLAL